MHSTNKEENLFVLKDLLGSWKIKFTNIQIQYQKMYTDKLNGTKAWTKISRQISNIFWYGHNSIKKLFPSKGSRFYNILCTTYFRLPPSNAVNISIPLHERMSVPKFGCVKIAWGEGERSADKWTKQRYSKMWISQQKQKSLGLLKWTTLILSRTAVNNYNSAHHRKIKIEPTEVKTSTYTYLEVENDNKGSKFKVGDWVRISKYNSMFSKGYFPNWLKEVFMIKKVTTQHNEHM